MDNFMHRNQVLIFSILLILLIAAGCQADTPLLPIPPTVTNISPPISTTDVPGETIPPETVLQVTTASITKTDIPEHTPEATPTRTPAPTLSSWREAPITPEQISSRVIEIYQNGQALGRDPHSFSVIGDCQSIPFVFMGPFGRGELAPGKFDNHLWKALSTFDPSFKRWSVTSRGGFTAASILNPIQADPQLCKPGETPLSCEFRLNNPAFALITLENWRDPDNVDRYEVYLRQIVESTIESGIVPILITKADGSEIRNGDHVINPMIVNIAYEHELPLVNFWRSAQSLENKGIDPDREGFHLSQAGYDRKNIVALRTLYLVWQAVEEVNIVVEIAPTPTPSPQPTQADQVEVSLPVCEPGNCIFFGAAHSHDGEIISNGVYAFAVRNQKLIRVLGTGFDLQDVKADGSTLLVNHSDQLYEVNLQDGSTRSISDSFYHFGKQGAFWNSNETDIIFLDKNNPIWTETGQAFALFPSASDDLLYFPGGTCTSKDHCQQEAIYHRDAEGVITELESFTMPVFSPDGSRVAFLNPEAATASNFFHINYLLTQETDTGINSRRVLYLPHEKGFMVYTDVIAYAFSPDNHKLFILYDVYSEYREHSLRLQTYLWNLENRLLYDFDHIEGISGSLNPRLVWSPESERVFFFLTDISEEGDYSISIHSTNITISPAISLYAENVLSSPDYLYLTNVYWR